MMITILFCNRGKQMIKDNNYVTNYKLMWLIFVTVLLSSSFSIVTSVRDKNSVDNVSVQYYFEIPSVKPVVIGDTVYSRIILPGSTYGGKPGEPSLPKTGAKILLPKGAEIKEINVYPSDKASLKLVNPIVPIGEPVPLSQTETTSFPVPDEKVYNSRDLFPGSLYTKVGVYCFKGYDVLYLTLYPVQYIPVTGELFYYENIKISVKTVTNRGINPSFRGFEEDKLDVMSRVDNPSTIQTYPDSLNDYNTLAEDDYDLLIITVDSLKNAFQILKNAHDADNVSTVIKTLTDIGSSTPEDIREFIRGEYDNHSIRYVLIGGDDDIIPAKRLYVEAWDNSGYEDHLPSDLYYACLDGTFNYDNDSKWGEPTDGENGGDVDLIAEVYVGRACVSNITETNIFVDKTLSQICQEGNGDYLQDVCLAGELLWNTNPPTWGGDYLDELVNGSSSNGYTTVGIPSSEYDIDRLYDRDWPTEEWTKEDLITRINNNIHILNHDGHSAYTVSMRMNKDDVKSLTNDKYCFIYSQGCKAGGFDRDDCIAEHFLVKTTHGAFAGIWNSRYGWAKQESTDGASQYFNRQFWDAIFGENISTIGQANHDSKEDNLHLVNEDCMRWCYYELNLLGDPTLSFHPKNSDPPDKPRRPQGEEIGIVGEQLVFTTNTTEPNGDQLYYKWSWGDNTYSNWLGPYDSGENVSASHIWNKRGNYDITVKARDVYGTISIKSEPLPIQIKGPVLTIGGITTNRGRINVNIKNTGDTDVKVKWSIHVYGGLLGRLNITSNGNVQLGSNQKTNSETISTDKPMLGFGRVYISVSLEAENMNKLTKRASGFLLLFVLKDLK